MKAIYFPEVNVEIAKDQPQYQTLPAHITAQGIMISKFQLTPEEIKSVIVNGTIWVQVMKGDGQLQPLSIIPVKDYFKQINVGEDGSYTIQADNYSEEVIDTPLLSKEQIKAKIEGYNEEYYDAVRDIDAEAAVSNEYYEKYITPMIDWIHGLQKALPELPEPTYKKGDKVMVLSAPKPYSTTVEKAEFDTKIKEWIYYFKDGERLFYETAGALVLDARPDKPKAPSTRKTSKNKPKAE